jgi:hypothetical protein
VCVEWYSPILGCDNDENVGLLKEWSKSRRKCTKLKAKVCSSWNIHTRNSDLQAQFYKLSQCTDLSVGSLKTRCFNSSCCCANKCISSLLIFLIVAAQIPPSFETSIQYWFESKYQMGSWTHAISCSLQMVIWTFSSSQAPNLPNSLCFRPGHDAMVARLVTGLAAQTLHTGELRFQRHGTQRHLQNAGSGLEGLVANLGEDLPVEDIPDITSQ